MLRVLEIQNQKIAKMLADNELLTKDSDGDGIPDYRDQCPEVKGAFVNGCNEMDGLKAGELFENINANNIANNQSKGKKITNNNLGTNSSIQNLSNNLKLELRSMLLVEMNKIYFGTNKANLNATDRVILTQCAKVIMDNPSFKLTILGYADNVGSDESNYILSKNRAEAVANYLENQGVSKDNVIIKAMGAQKMIGSDAKESNAYNRRVEFIIE